MPTVAMTVQEVAAHFQKRFDEIEVLLGQQQVVLNLLAEAIGRSGGQIADDFDKLLSTAVEGSTLNADEASVHRQTRSMLRGEFAESAQAPAKVSLRIVQDEPES